MKLLTVLPMLIVASSPAAAMPDAGVAEMQLRALNHRYITALAAADADSITALSSENLQITSRDGAWLDRAEFLELLRSTPAAQAASNQDVRIRLFGTVALVHGLLSTGSAPLVRYTDVYHWQHGGWVLVHSQHTSLREGASRATQSGAPLSIKPWQGQDPAGDVDTRLRTLNEHYVRAYREADVSWYDAHLSADYVVVNGDGSLSDRAAALRDFSQPSFATHMRSFPVGRVHVRLFDDVALIRAENDYEMKDGRRGVSRYTDIWQRQSDGRWLCIAAHITPFKLPG